MTLESNIQALFKDIYLHSDSLLKCLQDELTALNNNCYEELISLSEIKQDIISRLDDLDQQRLQLAGEDNFTDFITQKINNKTLTAQWQLTRSKIQACQQQNEVNGRLLQRRNRLAREAMDIMSGNNSNNATTYGRNGKTQPGASSLNKTQI